MKKPLRHGFTTGACAAAAAKGAALMLANQESACEVSINLPLGDCAVFQLHGQRFTANEAGCFVIKDAGDDPDVTNGAEVWATITVNQHPPPLISGACQVSITGGAGIGTVTKPGLAVPPGEWAINPVPRQMIEQAVHEVFTHHSSSITLQVCISIPDGEKRAKKTLNQRLGITGGLSILGTTGIVRPISAKAWTDTIDAALDVAEACVCENVVLSTGRTSEMLAQSHLTGFSEEAFIMMGDHVAHSLQSCSNRGFNKPVIACQFAKLLKIACGHENTHAAASELDLATLLKWAEDAGLSPDILNYIRCANTAREIAIASGFDTELIQLVVRRAELAATKHSPCIEAEFLVCGYNGTLALPRPQL